MSLSLSNMIGGRKAPILNEKYMKHIIIDDRNVKSDIVGDLCQIDLTRDIVICSPSVKMGEIEDVSFDVDEFNIYNRNDIKYDTSNNYIFFPRMKVMVPDGLKISAYCKMQGMCIVNHTIDKYKGIELDVSLPYDNLHLTLAAIKGKYNIYYRFEYIMNEFNRELFLRGTKTRGAGLRIPTNTNILSMHFHTVFQGGHTFDFNEVYIIRSDYLYDTFPNFGGQK